MKAKSLSLLLVLFLGSCCATTGTKGTTTDDGGLGPQPGGDCVININPTGGGYGAAFAIGYQFNGSEGSSDGDTYYITEIGSNDDIITVGLIGGTRQELTKGEFYDVLIKNLTGPTARVINKNNPAEEYEISVGSISSSDYRADGFAAIARPYESGGTDYTIIAIMKDDAGIYFHVDE